MWYDDFDADLYRVVPEAEAVLKPVKDIRLMTNGIPDENGKLNLPSVWNDKRGVWAFFVKADDAISSSAKIAPDPYLTDSPVIICTLEEAIRDCWPHQYAIRIPSPTKEPIWLTLWDSLFLVREFEILMAQARGWANLSPGDIEYVKEGVINDLMITVRLARSLS